MPQHRCGNLGLLTAVAFAAVGLHPASSYPPAPGGDPDHQLDIPGLGKPVFLGGSGIDIDGGTKLMIHKDSGATVANTCHPTWRPEDIMQFKLLGRTISFTVDLSKVGCGCNLAFYLVSAPARDEQGNAIPGDNMLAPHNFYCDANKVGGQWCPEVDIMEANTHAFASTPHKCDPPHNSHYNNCDRGGCGQNTRDMPNTYGPGPQFQINTQRPFDVITAFTANGDQLTGMVTTLQQDGHNVKLEHWTCSPEYYRALSPAMASGMSLRITYWGSDASAMAWLDSPPCGSQSCSGANTGLATISNIKLDWSTGASVNGQAIEVSSEAGVGSGGFSPSSQGFDCKEGLATWESGWKVEKQTWCCEQEGVACESFNCFEKLSHWGTEWSVLKKAWCCTHHFQGCPEGPGALNAGIREQIGPLRWSNHPKKCLTDMGGPSSALVIADCEGKSGNASQIWEGTSDGLLRLHLIPSRCVSVRSKIAEKGSPVVVTACKPNNLQQGFSMDPAKMKLRWKAREHMCLDVTDHEATNGTPLQVWQCLDTDTDQVFAWPVVDKAALPKAPAATRPVPSPSPSTAVPTTAAPTEVSAEVRKVAMQSTTTATPFDCSVPDLKTTPYRQRVWCCWFKAKGCPVTVPEWWSYEPPVPYAVHTRITAENKGASTEHMLHPGDVFQVQNAAVGLDGTLYLNLTGGRGWTSESKPGVGTICVEHQPAVHFSQEFSLPVPVQQEQRQPDSWVRHATSAPALTAWLAGAFLTFCAGLFALRYRLSRRPQSGGAAPFGQLEPTGGSMERKSLLWSADRAVPSESSD